MFDLKEWLLQTLLKLNLTNFMELKYGFTRLGFSKQEKLAHEQFRKIASNLGLKIWQDQVGNQWALWEVDPNAPTIGMGSHLDTVVEGGGYDGVAGIVIALGAIRELKRKNINPQKNIAVICFICEESARFGISTIGSKTIAGTINKSMWEKVTDKDNITIRQAMEEYGINWDHFQNAYCEENRFESFIELHIEQGNQLHKNKKDIGIVYGISTPIRLKVTAYGIANHTGTSLMDERNDALVAISPLISIVQEEALKINEKSKHPLVATVSTVNVQPNVMNVIPGTVELGIDIRSVDDKLKRDFAKNISSHCKRLAEKHQIKVKIEVLADEDSVIRDKNIQEKFSELCEHMGLSYCIMNSGAGHDVMNMAKRWPSGLIFIPSINGISHHPDEYTPLRNLELGVSVLTTYLTNEVGGYHK
ncbi:M20 family metallo-hydrolase [Caldifermentibacillus hisashii]|uniref:M20 family metallo-hydrolase n=1 Tax=Caldifermentibacillus hisashii TaxID=996558 RepID=UPI0033667C93